MSKLTEIISNSAKILANVLPLPGAAPILNLVSAAFGGSDNEDDLANKIASDPNAAVKLREIEENTKVQLQQIAAQQAQAQIAANTAMYESDQKDRENARSYAIQTKGYVQVVLAFLMFFGVFFTIAYIFLHGLPKESESSSILIMLISQLSNGLGMCLAFFLGTSDSSRKKDDMIFNSTPIKK